MYQATFSNSSKAARKSDGSRSGETRHSTISSRVRPLTALTAVERLAVSSKSADLGGGLLAGLQVDDLGVGGLLRVPQVLGDDVAHAGDLGELVADFRDGEVEMLRADEKNVVGLAIPDGAEQTGHQLDQAAGLLELLVFLE